MTCSTSTIYYNIVYVILQSVLSFSLRTKLRGTGSQSIGSRSDPSCLVPSASLFLTCVRGETKFVCFLQYIDQESCLYKEAHLQIQSRVVMSFVKLLYS